MPTGKIVIQKRGAKVTASGLNFQISVFRRALEMFAGLLSKKNVKLVCRGTECHTDGTTITIPELSILDRKGMTEEEVQRAAEFLEAIRGFVSHEVGHVLYTDFDQDKIREFAVKSALHKHIWNVVEDAYIEKKMSQLWAGVAVDLSNKTEWSLRKLVDPSKWQTLPPLMKVLVGFLDLCEKGGDHSKSWYYQGLDPKFKQVLAALDVEVRATLVAESTSDCVTIAQSIIDKLQLANQNQLPQQQQQVSLPPPEEMGEDEQSEASPFSQQVSFPEPEDGDEDEYPEDDAYPEDDEAEGDGSEDGEDGDGTEPDEDDAEGDTGSGDAQGEAEGDGDDSEADGEGLFEDKDEETEAEAEDKAPTGKTEEAGKKHEGESDPENNGGVANPTQQKNLLELEEELNKKAEDAENFSMENLISEEAKDQLNKLTRFNAPYTVFSTEWDKVGSIDDLMPLLAPGYVVDESEEKKVYGELAKKADAHIGVMKRRLQAILTTQTKPRHHRNLEDGDLDFANLYKFALTGTDESSRVFKRTTYTFANNEICVALVVNESGSMGAVQNLYCTIPDPTGKKDKWGNPVQVTTDPGCKRKKSCRGHGYVSRIQLAREVSLIFGETLGALGVPFRLVGHTAEPTSATIAGGGWGWSANNTSKTPLNPQLVRHYTRQGAIVLAEYKGWEERWNNVRHKMVRMTPRSNTYDGEVLLRVSQDIMQRKEKRKVIFMLDDGIPEPSDSNQEAHRKFLKSVVQDVTAAGVEVICLGMATPEVKEYYPKHVVINEVAETPMVATAQLKRLLMQHIRPG